MISALHQPTFWHVFRWDDRANCGYQFASSGEIADFDDVDHWRSRCRSGFSPSRSIINDSWINSTRGSGGKSSRWSAGLGSPEHFDEMAISEFAHRMYERACRPQGVVRQFRALRRDGSRSQRLSQINTPTLVIHGTSDTLIDISGGRRTAEVIGGAKFHSVEGMGHDCPPHFWDEIVGVVTAHAQKSDKVGYL